MTTNPAALIEADEKARALGFADAKHQAEYEIKMLGTPEERLAAKLRRHQYRGFDETNANLDEAAETIERLADALTAEQARADAAEEERDRALERLDQGRDLEERNEGLKHGLKHAREKADLATRRLEVAVEGLKEIAGSSRAASRRIAHGALAQLASMGDGDG